MHSDDLEYSLFFMACCARLDGRVGLSLSVVVLITCVTVCLLCVCMFCIYHLGGHGYWRFRFLDIAVNVVVASEIHTNWKHTPFVGIFF
jgi:hypothetical protein